jgi:GNAT superfamily N-acetyltransferase
MASKPDSIDISISGSAEELERRIEKRRLAEFLHESLKPFDDPVEEIIDGLDYALSDDPGRGGFVLLAEEDGEPVGSVVMLRTGMKGYIPENVLLYVAVRPDMRGRGVGGRIIRRSLEEAEGDVKLHVEYDNPAKRLYERIGFVSKYAEMRFEK